MNKPLFERPAVGTVPIGLIQPFSGQMELYNDQTMAALEASGWMLCDGRSLSVSHYPELFAVLGYSFGGKEEQFQIPDLRETALESPDNELRPSLGMNAESKKRKFNSIIRYAHR